MNTRTAIHAALLTVALVLPAVTANAEPAYQARVTGSCKFKFNKEPYVLHNAVVVGGVVNCDRIPFQFFIELQLWHKSGTSNPRPKGDPAVSMQIPNPNLNVAAMALDCVPGVWQGRIVMRATWDTGTDEVRGQTLPTILGC